MKTKPITAILDAGTLKGKVKIPTIQREIKIVLTTPTTVSFLQEAFVPDSPNRHKVMTFEWREQLKKYIHRYTLKEIE